MQCPYCVSKIDDAALACPHCAHDLYLYKPLLEKIGQLEAQLIDHPEVVPLKERIAELESQLAAIPPERQRETRSIPGLLLKLWLPPLVLLLLAHLLMTVIYDINTLWLRIASMLIPLPFGFALMRGGNAHFWRWCGAAFVLAITAVLGMSWVISRVDQVPVLPANLQELREFLEYAASIGFAWITGMLLGTMRHDRDQHNLALRLAQAAGKGKSSVEKLQSAADKVHGFVGSMTAAGTTAVSIYTGLKGLWGN